uniref:Restriction alleviation protein n=1 Tax=viral metagenome TaxID=1070528 RepID=A0A6M3JD36_9ZZZZ
MRQFKLLKDLPEVKAGTISHSVDLGSVHFKSENIISKKREDSFRYISFPIEFALIRKDWFEEIEKKRQITPCPFCKSTKISIDLLGLLFNERICKVKCNICNFQIIRFGINATKKAKNDWNKIDSF